MSVHFNQTAKIHVDACARRRPCLERSGTLGFIRAPPPPVQIQNGAERFCQLGGVVLSVEFGDRYAHRRPKANNLRTLRLVSAPLPTSATHSARVTPQYSQMQTEGAVAPLGLELQCMCPPSSISAPCTRPCPHASDMISDDAHSLLEREELPHEAKVWSGERGDGADGRPASTTRLRRRHASAPAAVAQQRPASNHANIRVRCTGRRLAG
eukprot:COSAG01_NODE_24612_length_773_cov_0.676558_1_plen_210_part_10